MRAGAVCRHIEEIHRIGSLAGATLPNSRILAMLGVLPLGIAGVWHA
jgi:hypothetical protein